jgi:hypothetical protein
LSNQRTGLPQAKQCEGGLTTDIRRGTLQISTLRNEPTTAPTAKA